MMCARSVKICSIFELRHGKTCFMPYANDKGADQPAQLGNELPFGEVNGQFRPLVSEMAPVLGPRQANLCLRAFRHDKF